MRAAQHGSLLVVTLWLITVLAVAAIALAGYLSIETRVVRYQVAHAQAKAWARAGIYLAMSRLADDNDEAYDWLGDGWAPVTTAEHLEVSITDEERKLPLDRLEQDAAMHASVAQLLESVEPADLIADYVDADADPRPSGLERSESTPPYRAKNASIIALEETREIPGVSDEQAQRLQQHATAQPIAKVNINTVSGRLLQALRLTAGVIDAIETYRHGPDGPEAHEQDGLFTDPSAIVSTIEARAQLSDAEARAQLSDAERTLLSNEFGVASQLFTVESHVTFEHPTVRARVEAVVRRGTPSEIIQWREG